MENEFNRTDWVVFILFAVSSLSGVMLWILLNNGHLIKVIPCAVFLYGSIGILRRRMIIGRYGIRLVTGSSAIGWGVYMIIIATITYAALNFILSKY